MRLGRSGMSELGVGLRTSHLRAPLCRGLILGLGCSTHSVSSSSLPPLTSPLAWAWPDPPRCRHLPGCPSGRALEPFLTETEKGLGPCCLTSMRLVFTTG